MASFIGGLSSLLILIEAESVTVKLLTITAKAATFTLIICIGFFGQPIKKMIIYGCIFFGLNALLCGAVGWLCEQFQVRSVLVSDGTIYMDIPLIMLILTTAGVYIALSVISRFTAFKYDKCHSYSVEFEYNDAVYNLPAIADTGNTASDVFSGKPVIVCNGISLYTSEADYIRPIPYSTVSGEGILYAIMPQHVQILDENGLKKDVDALVASADTKGDCRAIFNPKLLT